jgi:sporulation protein YlmC with PRC-barrel domain
MRHALLLAASAAALMAAPASAQEAATTPPATDGAQPSAGAAVEQPAPATEQPATEQPAEGTTETQVVTATGGEDAAAAPAAPAAGTPIQALTLAAERLQQVAQQIQDSGTGTEATGTTAATDATGATGTAGAIAGTAADVTADSAAAATGDGTAAGTAGATTEDGTTTTTIVTTDGSSQDLEREATEALDQFDGALQQYGASPEGQPAAQQVALIQQQSQQVRGQLEDDPQAASEGMQEMAEAALQLQTAQIPAEADSIIGKQLVSSDGEEAGEVQDVLITPDGQVNALVLGRGGALGLGGQQVAIQWSQVLIQGDQLTANMTADQIEQLPEYQTD